MYLTLNVDFRPISCSLARISALRFLGAVLPKSKDKFFASTNKNETSECIQQSMMKPVKCLKY